MPLTKEEYFKIIDGKESLATGGKFFNDVIMGEKNPLFNKNRKFDLELLKSIDLNNKDNHNFILYFLRNIYRGTFYYKTGKQSKKNKEKANNFNFYTKNPNDPNDQPKTQFILGTMTTIDSGYISGSKEIVTGGVIKGDLQPDDSDVIEGIIPSDPEYKENKKQKENINYNTKEMKDFNLFKRVMGHFIRSYIALKYLTGGQDLKIELLERGNKYEKHLFYNLVMLCLTYQYLIEKPCSKYFEISHSIENSDLFGNFFKITNFNRILFLKIFSGRVGDKTTNNNNFYNDCLIKQPLADGGHYQKNDDPLDVDKVFETNDDDTNRTEMKKYFDLIIGFVKKGDPYNGKNVDRNTVYNKYIWYERDNFFINFYKILRIIDCYDEDYIDQFIDKDEQLNFDNIKSNDPCVKEFYAQFKSFDDIKKCETSLINSSVYDGQPIFTSLIVDEIIDELNLNKEYKLKCDSCKVLGKLSNFLEGFSFENSKEQQKLNKLKKVAQKADLSLRIANNKGGFDEEEYEIVLVVDVDSFKQLLTKKNLKKPGTDDDKDDIDIQKMHILYLLKCKVSVQNIIDDLVSSDDLNAVVSELKKAIDVKSEIYKKFTEEQRQKIKERIKKLESLETVAEFIKNNDENINEINAGEKYIKQLYKEMNNEDQMSFRKKFKNLTNIVLTDGKASDYEDQIDTFEDFCKEKEDCVFKKAQLDTLINKISDPNNAEKDNITAKLTKKMGVTNTSVLANIVVNTFIKPYIKQIIDEYSNNRNVLIRKDAKDVNILQLNFVFLFEIADKVSKCCNDYVGTIKSSLSDGEGDVIINEIQKLSNDYLKKQLSCEDDFDAFVNVDLKKYPVDEIQIWEYTKILEIIKDSNYNDTMIDFLINNFSEESEKKKYYLLYNELFSSFYKLCYKQELITKEVLDIKLHQINMDFPATSRKTMVTINKEKQSKKDKEKEEKFHKSFKKMDISKAKQQLDYCEQLLYLLPEFIKYKFNKEVLFNDLGRLKRIGVYDVADQIKKIHNKIKEGITIPSKSFDSLQYLVDFIGKVVEEIQDKCLKVNEGEELTEEQKDLQNNISIINNENNKIKVILQTAEDLLSENITELDTVGKIYYSKRICNFLKDNKIFDSIINSNIDYGFFKSYFLSKHDWFGEKFVYMVNNNKMPLQDHGKEERKKKYEIIDMVIKEFLVCKRFAFGNSEKEKNSFYSGVLEGFLFLIDVPFTERGIVNNQFNIICIASEFAPDDPNKKEEFLEGLKKYLKEIEKKYLSEKDLTKNNDNEDEKLMYDILDKNKEPDEFFDKIEQNEDGEKFKDLMEKIKSDPDPNVQQIDKDIGTAELELQEYEKAKKVFGNAVNDEFIDKVKNLADNGAINEKYKDNENLKKLSKYKDIDKKIQQLKSKVEEFKNKKKVSTKLPEEKIKHITEIQKRMEYDNINNKSAIDYSIENMFKGQERQETLQKYETDIKNGKVPKKKRKKGQNKYVFDDKSIQNNTPTVILSEEEKDKDKVGKDGLTDKQRAWFIGTVIPALLYYFIFFVYKFFEALVGSNKDNEEAENSLDSTRASENSIYS